MSEEERAPKNDTASSQPDATSDILETAENPADEDPADPSNTEVR